MDRCEQPVGSLVSVQGTVEVRQEPDGGWRPAFLNELLCEGTVLRVGDWSRAEVTLIDQSKYRIDQNSTLRLVQVHKDAPSLMNLITGVAYFFSRQPRVLQIDTPFVNAAVEGTEFLLSVDADQTLLTVFEGKVVAGNDHGRLPVTSGESALTRAGEPPQPYLLVRPRDAVQWALYYPFVLLPLADPSGVAAQACRRRSPMPSCLPPRGSSQPRSPALTQFPRRVATPSFTSITPALSLRLVASERPRPKSVGRSRPMRRQAPPTHCGR